MPPVRIVQLSPAAIAALAAGDCEAASELSGLPLGADFVSAGMSRTWRRRSAQLAQRPDDEPWITGIVLDGGTPVGRAGFHGAPTAGRVEVGYEILPAFRRRGYATAALASLVRRAVADPGISTLRASISPGNLASLATIAGWRFVRVGEHLDPEDGLEEIFELHVGSGRAETGN